MYESGRDGPRTPSSRDASPRVSGLVSCFAELAARLRQDSGLERVCLSGGVFQNAWLLEHLLAALRADGFEVFAHAATPAGDGGLSLGQAVVAASASETPDATG